MKNFEFTIRPAEIQDAEKIHELLDEVGAENIYIMAEPGERTVCQIEELIRNQVNNRTLLLVADRHGEIIGVVGLTGGIFRKTSHVLEMGMAIRREFRGSGLGSTLLREAVGWARKKGFCRVELGVLTTNGQAIALYKKFGFQEEGQRKQRYRVEGKYVDELLMSKIL